MLEATISLTSIHFGKNPIKGGRPARLARITIIKRGLFVCLISSDLFFWNAAKM